MSKIKFGLSKIDRNGFRSLMTPASGQYLFDTREEADEWLRAMLADPNNNGRLEQIYGAQSTGTFRTDPFRCHENGDPMGVFVESEEETNG